MDAMLRFFQNVLPFSNSSTADWPGSGMMGPGMMGWSYGMGWPWFILMIIFWIAVVAAVVLLIRWLLLSTRTAPDRQKEESAVDILKKRYARGEINKEEFEEKKGAIEK